MAIDLSPAAVRAATVEQGYQRGGLSVGIWGTWSTDEAPELSWPLSVAVYDRMVRDDGQVASSLSACKLPIERAAWSIDPAQAREEVVRHVATDLGLPVIGEPGLIAERTAGRFSWRRHLSELLTMLDFGHSFFEQVYRLEGTGSAGRLRLRKLAWRPPDSIAQINVASDGGLESIRQWSRGTGQERPIPVDRLVAYVREQRGGDWTGRSLLRTSYKPWLAKNPTLRVWLQGIERNAMGVPVYKLHPGSTAADRDAALTVAQGHRAGSAAGAVLPDGDELDLLGVKGTLVDPEKAIRYLDEQIYRSPLLHFLNLGTQTGSWALGSTFADFFVMALQASADQIAETAQAHVVEDIVDRNYGPGEPAPRLVVEEIGSRQVATAAAIKLLLDSGVIFADRQLEEAVRQQYGLPPKPPAQTTGGG